MVTEYDLPCTDCGGKITPVEVPIDGNPGTKHAVKRIGKCIDCGARHYPRQALEDLSG